MPEAVSNRLMSESLAVIEAEHAALAAILSGLRYFVRNAARGVAPDAVVLEKMLDYVEYFPERLHHPREDEHLFRRLRARTHDTDDMLDRLEAEHEAGARRLAELRAAMVDWHARGERALPALAALLDTYTAGYLSHMNAEERWILPAARAHLTGDDWQAIHVAFCATPDPLTGADAQAVFTRLFHEIARLAPAPIGIG
jgi:branched-chain amino acid transport system ATP-binding protein